MSLGITYPHKISTHSLSAPKLPLDVPRGVAINRVYGVLTSVTDHSGYPDGSVKILVVGFLDENNHWVYQPFAVNLGDNKTKPGDYIQSGSSLPNISPAPEGFKLFHPFSNRLDSTGYGAQKLIALVGHEIGGEASTAFDSNGTGPAFSQLMLGGIESFIFVSDAGEAPVSPVSGN